MYQRPSHDDSTSLIGPRAEVGTGLPAMDGSANGTPTTPLVWLMSTCSSAATIAAPATTHSREKMYTNPTLRRMRYQVAGVSSTGASCGPRVSVMWWREGREGRTRS